MYNRVRAREELCCAEYGVACRDDGKEVDVPGGRMQIAGGEETAFGPGRVRWWCVVVRTWRCLSCVCRVRARYLM